MCVYMCVYVNSSFYSVECDPRYNDDGFDYKVCRPNIHSASQIIAARVGEGIRRSGRNIIEKMVAGLAGI